MSDVKCLCVGDVQGQFQLLIERINSINNKNGPFDILFCLGEFFGPNDDENAKLISGSYNFPFDTYILGPCCPQTAQNYQLEDGDEFCPNLTYLGKKGILFSAWGISVAYLSGIQGKTSNAFQFTDEDIQDVMLPLRSKPDFIGVDLLLTAEWPEDVDKNSINQPPKMIRGSSLISRLAAGLKPRYHFAGKNGHFERTPYRNHRVLMENAQHVTRFIGLASVGNTDKEKFIYAFTIKPMKSMPRVELTKQPEVTSEFPYMGVLQRYITSQSQQSQQGGGFSRFDMTHYSDEEEQEDDGGRGGRKRRGRGDHGPASKKHDQNITSDNCWFCLSNVDAEKHLVISVGTHAYLSLPKGGLNDKHAMILTVGHIRSMVEASEEIRNEINQFKDSYVLMCDQQGQSVFTFERNFKTSHLQLQLIPVPKEKAKALKAVLISEADRCGLEFCFLKEDETMLDVVKEGTPYFFVELPDGSKLFLSGQSITNLDLNFARQVLANSAILNCPQKVDWRNCVLKKEQEIEIAGLLKKAFKTFDFNADSDDDSD